MTKPTRRNDSGLSETQVMDLWDAGQTDDQIAQTIGKPLSVVRRILWYMGAHEALIFHQRAIAMGSARLAAAIAQARAQA